MRPRLTERIRLWICRTFGHKADPADPIWCRRCGMTVTSKIGRI